MGKSTSGSKDVEYDSDRLADDPEYRDKVLNEIASKSSTLTKATVTRWLLYVIFGLSFFTVGLYVGGRMDERLTVYTALMLTCFIIVPALGYLLYYRYES